VPEEYLKPAETAAKIHVSVDKLAIDRMNGVGLPFVVFGTAIRYPLSAVEAYMSAHTILPGMPTPPGVQRRKGGPGCRGLATHRRSKRAARN